VAGIIRHYPSGPTRGNCRKDISAANVPAMVISSSPLLNSGKLRSWIATTSAPRALPHVGRGRQRNLQMPSAQWRKLNLKAKL
jgi:hypothetical protein